MVTTVLEAATAPHRPAIPDGWLQALAYLDGEISEILTGCTSEELEALVSTMGGIL